MRLHRSSRSRALAGLCKCAPSLSSACTDTCITVDKTGRSSVREFAVFVFGTVGQRERRCRCKQFGHLRSFQLRNTCKIEPMSRTYRRCAGVADQSQELEGFKCEV